MSVDELQTAFEEAYWSRFAVQLPEIRAVLVNLHTAAIGRRPGIPLEALAGRDQTESVAEAQVALRRVWFERGWCESPVYDRARLPADAVITGPAIVQQLDCTTAVEPGDRVTLDRLGNMMIEVRHAIGSSGITSHE